MFRTNLASAATVAATIAVALTLSAGPTALASSPDEEDDQTGQNAEEPLPILGDAQAHQLRNEIGRLRQQADRLASGHRSAHPLTVDDALRQVASPRGPQQIFDWIDDNISFEAYSGAMRGPEGTLVDRAGNAADQALLAADMLIAAGHDLRFVTGQLHDADITRIVDGALGSATLFNREHLEPRTFARRSSPLRSSLIRDLSNHVWLEVKAGQHYRPFDPVSAPTYGMTTANKADSHDELPASHIVQFEMKLVSHLEDGQVIQHLAVDGPLWHLAFRALTIGFEPDPTRRRGHRPVLVLEGDRLTGTTIAVDALQRLQLEFSLRDTGHDHRFTQVLYRRGQGVDIFDFDHQHFAIALTPGRVTDEKLRQVATTAASGALDETDKWISAEVDDALDDNAQRLAVNGVLDHLGPALPFAFARNLDRQLDAVAEVFGVTPVLTRPRVLTAGILRRGDEFFVDLQVDGGRLQALPADGVPTVATTAFLGHYGLLTDRLIGEMIDAYSDSPSPTVDAIFQEARRQSIRFTTIDSQRMSHLDFVEIGDATREVIEDQIRNRNMVIMAPIRPIDDDGMERFGWWAVNPFDGNMEGHSRDAVVAVATDEGGESASRSALMESHLRLLDRHFQAAGHAIEEGDRFAELICTTALHFDQYSRGFCATSQALPRANLGTCLDNPPTPGGDLLSMTQIDCGQQLADIRCASAYAVALLVGRKVVTDDPDPTIQSLAEPLCD